MSGQGLVAGLWFSSSTPVSSTIKTDHHDIAEILLKVALNTITLILTHKNHTILRELMKYIRRSET